MKTAKGPLRATGLVEVYTIAKARLKDQDCRVVTIGRTNGLSL